jgi:phosphonoacetate hydrolase
VLPITDPYVAHHGSLGGFAWIYCGSALVQDVMKWARALPGVEAVYDRDCACREFELPRDRVGDVAVVADAGTALGSAPEGHDLSGLAGHRLRSHGGTAERRVPFILSRPLNDAYARRAAEGPVRNYDIFDYALNGVWLDAGGY